MDFKIAFKSTKPFETRLKTLVVQYHPKASIYSIQY